MDLKSLEALGITAEDLTERIVDKAVNDLLYSTGFDSESDSETRYVSRFQEEVKKRIQEAVDIKIAALAAEHLIPRVGQMIEAANLQKTNSYGEKKGEPMTFIEYIAARADAYMSEDVNHNGQSKAEMSDSYNWKSSGPRLTVLMRNYIRETMETHAKKAIADVNQVFARNIEKAAKDAIAAASASLKVAIAV